MPYYSELGIYTGPFSSSTGAYISSPYSNHSSLLASNFTRPPPVLLKPRNFRGYKPLLATITENHAPLRRINSPKLLLHASPKISVARPIKINTADIDVSVNKYRKFERANKQSDERVDRKSESEDSPRSSQEKEAKPNKIIRRDRPTVRLNTIHGDAVPTGATKSWRDNFEPDELNVEEEKRPRKSPGELLKEKFWIRSREDIFKAPTKKVSRRASKKTTVQKTPSFHDICSAISTDQINEELNPGQPIEIQRRQSRRHSIENVLKELNRSATGTDEIVDSKTDELPETRDGRHQTVKTKKKFTKKKSNEKVNLTPASPEADGINKSALQRRPTQKKIRRTSTNSSLESDVSSVDVETQKAYQEAIRDISQVEIERIKIKPKPIITATVDVEEKPALKAIVNDIEIVESPKLKKPNKFKFNVIVEVTDAKRRSLKASKRIIREQKGVVHLPKGKEVIVSNILMKHNNAHRGHILEDIKEFPREESKRVETAPKSTTNLAQFWQQEKKVNETISSKSKEDEILLKEIKKKEKQGEPLTSGNNEEFEDKTVENEFINKNGGREKQRNTLDKFNEESTEVGRSINDNVMKKCGDNHQSNHIILVKQNKYSNKSDSAEENYSRKSDLRIKSPNIENQGESRKISEAANFITNKIKQVTVNEENKSSPSLQKPNKPKETAQNVVQEKIAAPEVTKTAKTDIADTTTAETKLNDVERSSKIEVESYSINTNVEENKKENSEEDSFWETLGPRESVYAAPIKTSETEPLQKSVENFKNSPNEPITQKPMPSKRSLVDKATQDDPDLVVFEPPKPEPEPKPEESKPSFVPLQTNRISQFMHPLKKPEQFDECPVEIFATPKVIRHRHYPRPRPTATAAVSESNSDSEEESEEESTESNETSSDDEYDVNVVYGSSKVGASTSSNDSGFDSGVPGSRNKECDVNCHKKCEKLTANLCGINQKLIVEAIESVRKDSTETRDSPTSNSTHNSALTLDSAETPETYSHSSTFATFQKSGRITPPATTIPRFRKYTVDDFNFLSVLGKGSFGKVLLAELKCTEYYYAIKCLKKDVVLEDDDVECTLIERKVLALATKHPYLCHLLCTFQTESHLFFVMEYLNGGDLMFHIQKSGRFEEARARFYGAEIVSGLKFLHNKGIVYRDLKLDNILLDFDGHVRIADFGMCKLQIFLDRMADTFCGTPDYMAPEIIKGQHYNQCVDWWSFGILLYEMLLGQSPFSGCDEDELFWSICNEKPVLPRFLSAEASAVLLLFLEKNANKRLGNRFCPAGDIQDQPFFRHIDWNKLEARLLEPPFKPHLQHPLDTQYFDRTFTAEKAKLTPIEQNILQSMDQTQFQGFSYTNPNATDK